MLPLLLLKNLSGRISTALPTTTNFIPRPREPWSVGAVPPGVQRIYHTMHTRQQPTHEPTSITLQVVQRNSLPQCTRSIDKTRQDQVVQIVPNATNTRGAGVLPGNTGHMSSGFALYFLYATCMVLGPVLKGSI